MNLDDIEWWRDHLEQFSHPGATVLDAQIMHIGAEYGEFLQEWQIHCGYNPRKPKQFRGVELRKELADIIITSMVTLAMFDNSWRELIEARLTEVTERVKT